MESTWVFPPAVEREKSNAQQFVEGLGETTMDKKAFESLQITPETLKTGFKAASGKATFDLIPVEIFEGLLKDYVFIDDNPEHQPIAFQLPIPPLLLLLLLLLAFHAHQIASLQQSRLHQIELLMSFTYLLCLVCYQVGYEPSALSSVRS